MRSAIAAIGTIAPGWPIPRGDAVALHRRCIRQSAGKTRRQIAGIEAVAGGRAVPATVLVEGDPRPITDGNPRAVALVPDPGPDAWLGGGFERLLIVSVRFFQVPGETRQIPEQHQRIEPSAIQISRPIAGARRCR